jgi:guanylate kinase
MSSGSVRERGAGLVFVVSAPSGAGKTTLVRRLLGKVGGLGFSVSCTTRPRREGEQDGVDYHFLDEERFALHAASGEFLESAEVHGRRYGTLRSEVERIRAAGADAVLDVDVQGAEAVRRALPDAVLIFLLPPGLGELRRRLEARGTAPPEQERRLQAARRECDRAPQFDYLVTNERLEEALILLEAIVLAERSRAARRQDAWREVATTFPLA